MDPIVVGVIGIVMLIVLLLLEVHIGITMMLVGFCGYIYIMSWNGALGLLKTMIFSTCSSYTLTVIPLFVLMGQLAFYSGLSQQLFSVSNKWLSRLPGGLAVTTVAACAFFASICGSSPAMTATMGKVALPEMRRYNYADRLATGSIAAGGNLGILIPPSVTFIIYGVMSSCSIGQLFASGVIPGVMLAIFYCLAIFLVVWRDPSAGPKGDKFTLKEKLASLKDLIGMVVLFVVVIGGIFSGLFTAYEAAAMGCAIALIYMIVRGKFDLKTLKSALLDTTKTVGMVFLVMVGATIFGAFLAVTTIPSSFAAFVAQLTISRYLIMAMIVVIYIILGCLMDALAMVMLTVPIFLPVVLSLGFDPVLFGVIIVLVSELGLITPPVGLNVYIMAGVAKDVSMQTIFRGVMPFWFSILAAIILLIIFPQLALWLPQLLY